MVTMTQRLKPILIFATLPVAVAIFTIGPFPAQAQQGAPLTLQAALDLASKQNLDLIAARSRQAVAKAGIQIARQRPNPTFSFTALRDDPHEGVFFDQPIEIGGKRGRRIDVAHQESALTDAEIAALERQIRRDTRGAYYNLAFARADTQRLGRMVELATRLKQIAEERFHAGAVAELEVIQADLGLSRAQADLQVAGQREMVALSQLNALLNVASTTSWISPAPSKTRPSTLPCRTFSIRLIRRTPGFSTSRRKRRSKRAAEACSRLSASRTSIWNSGPTSTRRTISMLAGAADLRDDSTFFSQPG